jgi:hypothetical protein
MIILSFTKRITINQIRFNLSSRKAQSSKKETELEEQKDNLEK